MGAGRPPKEEKKEREAIYFEPRLLAWLRVKAGKHMTVSALVNMIVEKEMKKEGGVDNG